VSAGRIPVSDAGSREAETHRAMKLVPTVDQHERQPAKVLRKLKHAEKALAGEMRNSGVCVFDDWSTGTLTELSVSLSGIHLCNMLSSRRPGGYRRQSQAMLSGCVVATVTPNIQSGKQNIIPLGFHHDLLTCLAFRRPVRSVPYCTATHRRCHRTGHVRSCQ
jgi:hypothetical protein